MDHKRGKDPTPQGRMPGREQPSQIQASTEVDERYANSAPGPEQMEDGAAFFGYKRENAYPKRPNTQP